MAFLLLCYHTRMTDKPMTLSEHLSRAAKVRHAKRTPQERSDYARMMVRAREEKRKRAKLQEQGI